MLSQGLRAHPLVYRQLASDHGSDGTQESLVLVSRRPATQAASGPSYYRWPPGRVTATVARSSRIHPAHRGVTERSDGTLRHRRLPARVLYLRNFWASQIPAV